MVWWLIGSGVLGVGLASLGCWLTDRQLARARRSLAEEHDRRDRLGL